MDSSADRLTPLQRGLLHLFFQRERGFYLTGGAALAGFYLFHRTTSDLDLFTSDAGAFERGSHALRDAANVLGGAIEARLRAPGFQRSVVHVGPESVVVDLALDTTPQLFDEKPVVGGVVVDPPQEILANKLTALLSRSEERDLVDVMLLERAGFTVESALEGALAKDGACTPAALAWVLSQISIPDGAELPAALDPAAVRDYLSGLILRLRRAASPLVREPDSKA